MPISLSHFIYALCNKTLQVLDRYLNSVKQLSNFCCFIKKLITYYHPVSQTFWSFSMFTASSPDFPLLQSSKFTEKKKKKSQV